MSDTPKSLPQDHPTATTHDAKATLPEEELAQVVGGAASSPRDAQTGLATGRRTHIPSRFTTG